MENFYDLIIIGSGPAGHTAAIAAASGGLKTAMVDNSNKELGGVCLNEGCIPVKTLLSSAKKMVDFKNMGRLINANLDTGTISMDPVKLKEHMILTVKKARKGLEYVSNKAGIDIVYGKARFKDEHTVAISNSDNDDIILGFKTAVISTGSSPFIPGPFQKISGKVVTSTEMIKDFNIPSKLLVVGGGAIGVEFADLFRSLGADVTLIEMEGKLLPFADEEVSRALAAYLKKRGIKIFTNTIVDNVIAADTKTDVEVRLSTDGTYEDITADMVLLAAGRSPNTHNIGLKEAGVMVDGRGYIKVDNCLRTANADIYAAGDVIGGKMLAHEAQDHGYFIAERIMSGSENERPLSRICPYAVYTGVKAAGLGETESALISKNIPYAKKNYYFRANGRALAEGEDTGFIKTLIDVDSRNILGVHILGAKADEMINEYAVAMRNGITIDSIARTVHAHPTFLEAVKDAAEMF